MSAKKNNLIHIFVAFIVGVLFAAGLVISKMTDPQVVIGFLDIFGDWRPELLFVMAGAIAIHMPAARFILKKKQPLFDSQFHLSKNSKIDLELVLGAAIFGIGWGLAGICPGPALVSLATGTTEVLWFVLFMILGIRLKSHFSFFLKK